MEHVKKLMSSVRGSMLLAVGGGCITAVQIRINGGLGQAMDAPLVAAFIAFVIGMFCAWLLVAARPAATSVLQLLRVGRRKWWLFTGGLYGAFYVTVFIVASPIVGVAATAVAMLAGQIAGGLFLDKLRVFNNTPITLLRLVGAGLAIMAVAVSQLGSSPGSWRPDLLILLWLSGVAVGTQAAVQGKFRAETGSLWLVTAVNFTLGSLILLLVLLGTLLLGAIRIENFPLQWWLYTGGLLGALFVAISAFVVPVIGVLRLVMAIATGRLLGAMLLDYLTPIGPGFRLELLLAAALTIAGLWAASSAKRFKLGRHSSQIQDEPS